MSPSTRVDERVASDAMDAGDYARAHALAMPLAAEGSVVGQAILAYLLTHGLGVPADPEAGIPLWRRAAGAGHLPAMYMLACAYDRGLGVAEDRVEALRLYQQAADGGLQEAQHAVGLYHLEGEVVPEDVEHAIACFRQAAAQGYAPAEEMLADLLAGEARDADG